MHGAPVIVVETRAHTTKGHFPVMFAELAHSIAELGSPAVALTLEGALLDDQPGSSRVEVRRFGATTRRSYALGMGLRRGRDGSWRGSLGATICDLATVAATRALMRTLGSHDVVMTSQGVDPLVIAVAAGPGNWLLCEWTDRPAGAFHARSRVGRKLFELAARRSQARRRRRDWRLRVAVNNDAALEQWRQRVPWLEPQRLPFISAVRGRRRDARSIASSRERLGLAPDARYALLFGAPHPQKNHDVVFRAFEEVDECQLVVAGGGAADGYRRWRAGHPEVRREPVLFEGYVTSETRDLLHDAADVVVLSFTPGHRQDSGTLVGAIASDVPVVCSGGGFAGDCVERFRLGAVFAPGDVEALRNALRIAPRAIAAEDLERARGEFAPSRMAELVLAALRA